MWVIREHKKLGQIADGVTNLENISFTNFSNPQYSFEDLDLQKVNVSRRLKDYESFWHFKTPSTAQPETVLSFILALTIDLQSCIQIISRKFIF